MCVFFFAWLRFSLSLSLNLQFNLISRCANPIKIEFCSAVGEIFIPFYILRISRVIDLFFLLLIYPAFDMGTGDEIARVNLDLAQSHLLE